MAHLIIRIIIDIYGMQASFSQLKNTKLIDTHKTINIGTNSNKILRKVFLSHTFHVVSISCSKLIK